MELQFSPVRSEEAANQVRNWRLCLAEARGDHTARRSVAKELQPDSLEHLGHLRAQFGHFGPATKIGLFLLSSGSQYAAKFQTKGLNTLSIVGQIV